MKLIVADQSRNKIASWWTDAVTKSKIYQAIFYVISL